VTCQPQKLVHSLRHSLLSFQPLKLAFPLLPFKQGRFVLVFSDLLGVLNCLDVVGDILCVDDLLIVFSDSLPFDSPD
jgi:hypothetical protein